MRALLVLLIFALCGPFYSGPDRLPLFGEHPKLRTEMLPRPAQARVGRLTWLGGIRLRADDPAFGGFSAMAVRDGRVQLLSDGGNLTSFALDHGGRAVAPRFGELPGGPRTGWEKRDRDSESLTFGPDGRAWAGFESANEIWRYSPGFARAEGGVRPRAMRRWHFNGGPESMTRLSDGRFLVISEKSAWPGQPGRAAIVFAGDPLRHPRDGFGFTYMPDPGFEPSDAATLPNGDVLVLERQWLPPVRFRSRIVRLPSAALTPGARVRGREVARIAPPLPTENYEGIAVSRQAGRTIVWLVSDNDQMVWRPSYLLKFRLD